MVALCLLLPLLATPPLPPSELSPLSPEEKRRVDELPPAPPPSPPYAHTPAGRREAGRGVRFNRELSRHLQGQLARLRHGSVVEKENALLSLSRLALETTQPLMQTSWLAGVHPVAFRKACVSRSQGSASVVDAIVSVLAEAPQGRTRALALQ
ncbi:MAG: hypothetical protein SGPRY_014842, partial [Prymnesium sp.]